jgi:hypothetical protein
MVKVSREDGTFSDPFLCITGPMAIPLQGEVFDTRMVFDLNDEEPLPLVHGASRLPELIAPTSFSLSASPREWIEATAPSQLLLKARSHGRFLTVLDSSTPHTAVPIRDHTSHIWTRLRQENIKIS